MDTGVLFLIIVGVLLVGGFIAWRLRPSTDIESRVEPAPTTAPTGLGAAIRRVLGSRLGEDTWEALEETLIAADVGAIASGEIVSRVRADRPESVDQARMAIARALEAELAGGERELVLTGYPAVLLVVGVNGAGKTTTIAKLARLIQDSGRRVTLGAADTFRAGAAEQLETWGRRVGAQVVRGQQGGDPAAVVFDAIESARARGNEVVIIDTAGRLHDKKNLMAELQKIHRVAGGDQVDEVLLVLDATAGQNGLAQVAQFGETVPLSGIVLTKLDGTAKGGIVIAVERSLGVPVKFVGLGEGLEDLKPFEPDEFIKGLLA